MEFYSLDVETANADYSSICQVGICKYNDTKLIDKYSQYINPEDEFSPINISIHGITPEDVKKAPTFSEVYSQIRNMIKGNIVAHHMPFDRIAMQRVLERYQLEVFNVNWLDTACVARRAWEEFAFKGYGLKNIAKTLIIDFTHHDAVEDARVAGEILIAACKKHNTSIEYWVDRVKKPINLSDKEKETLQGNPEGILYGEQLVFTGEISIPRREAADMAAKIGCQVNPNVTKGTTMLVIGMQDTRKLKGKDKSRKQRRVEDLIQKGQSIRILSENDFFQILNT